MDILGKRQANVQNTRHSLQNMPFSAVKHPVRVFHVIWGQGLNIHSRSRPKAQGLWLISECIRHKAHGIRHAVRLNAR
eukprot:7150848-Lingulodinium_polyedra.AAC.1